MIGTPLFPRKPCIRMAGMRAAHASALERRIHPGAGTGPSPTVETVAMRSSLRKSLLRVAGVTGLLLLVPLVAMQFTAEVDWGPADFLVGGALLFGAGTAMVLAMRRFERPLHRALAVGAIALALALVWAELAVGLFR